MIAAVNLLRQLRAAEIDVTADADRLRLRSRTPLPAGLIELVRKHKPERVAAQFERSRDVVQSCTYLWDPSPHAARRRVNARGR
jgi:hypothetical protein